MKQLLLFTVMCWLCHFLSSAQGSCATPTVVTLCPGGVSLANQTTTGMGNDRSSWKFYMYGYTYTLNGNDNIYEVNLPVGAQTLWVDTKSTSTLYVISTGNTCNATYYSSLNSSYSGCQRQSIGVSGLSKIYVWIDHNNASDITYDISFGVVTGWQYYAKGVLQPAYSCMTPIFNSKFGLYYNGVQQPYPLVYSPLNVQGTVCYKIFLKNPSGIESIKKIRFTFGADLTNPAPAVASMPGFYSTGNWVANQVSSNIIEYNFIAPNGRGDYSSSLSCNAYQFCFTFTPTSNSPATTTTSYTWWGDNIGNYSDYTGCFASGTCNTSMSCSANFCLGASGASTAASGSGSSTDPFLPVTLTEFTAEKLPESILLHWSTGTETNSGSFEIQRSENGIDFTTIGTVEAVGNSSEITQYVYSDEHPLSSTAYYRLKETDIDGTISMSPVISVNAALARLVMFPNPAKSKINIASDAAVSGISVCDLTGNELLYQDGNSALNVELLLEGIKPGTYLIKIKTELETNTRRLIIE